MARRIRWQIIIATISAVLVVILLSGLALSNTTVSRPLTGGTYVEVVIGIPTSYLPLMPRAQTDVADYDLDALLFDGLTRIGRDGLPEPALAESWTIDPSGDIYTIRLRRDVVWHDGHPFNADDVIFTLRTIQSGSFTGDPSLANLWRNILVDRVDDYTIRCTLNAPYAPFLSAARVPILPAHVLEGVPMNQWTTTAFAKLPVGTGPYRMVELAPDHALLDANPTYAGGIPYINRIELRFVDSPQAAISLFTSLDAQAIGFNNTPELRQVALPARFRRTDMPLDAYTTLTFNLRQPPLDNGEVRQALARGLDKDTLIENVNAGAGTRIDTPILPGWWAYDPASHWYDYDPIAAAQALDSLGYPLAPDGVRTHDGQPLVLSLITDNDPDRLGAAHEIARQWGNLGIPVTVEELDRDTLRQRLHNHDFSLAVHGWTRLGTDPDVFELWHSSQATDGLNYAGLHDDIIDRALLNGRRDLDLVACSQDYAEFQRRWIELVPGITLYQPVYSFATSTNVGGMGFAPVDGSGTRLLTGREDRYRSVTDWFIQSSQEIRGTLQ